MTDQFIIYHNPRCSKSRQTLQLLKDNNISFTEIRYLDTPPTEEILTDLIAQLGISPRDLLRKGETEYKSLELENTALSDAEIIQAMVQHPKLIERPIVVKKQPTGETSAVLGRPPENVLNLIH
jgi:arsenate reductase